MIFQPETAEAALYESSFPYELDRIAPGILGYVTLDQDMRENRLVGRLHVSVVDTRSRRSCGDASVDVPEDPLPRVVLRADTVVVMYQDLTPEQRPRLMVKRFLIDQSACQWATGKH